MSSSKNQQRQQGNSSRSAAPSSSIQKKNDVTQPQQAKPNVVVANTKDAAIQSVNDVPSLESLFPDNIKNSSSTGQQIRIIANEQEQGKAQELRQRRQNSSSNSKKYQRQSQNQQIGGKQQQPQRQQQQKQQGQREQQPKDSAVEIVSFDWLFPDLKNTSSGTQIRTVANQQDQQKSKQLRASREQQLEVKNVSSSSSKLEIPTIEVLSLSWLFLDSTDANISGPQIRTLAKEQDQQRAKQVLEQRRLQLQQQQKAAPASQRKPLKQQQQQKKISPQAQQQQKKVSPQEQQQQRNQQKQQQPSRNLEQLKYLTNAVISLGGLFPETKSGASKSSPQTRTVSKKEDQFRAKQRLLAVEKSKRQQSRNSANRKVNSSVSSNTTHQRSVQKTENLRQQQRRLQGNHEQSNWELNLNGLTQLYPDALANVQLRDLTQQNRIVDAYSAVLKSFFNSAVDLSNRSENSKCSATSAVFIRNVKRQQNSKSRQQNSSSFNDGLKNSSGSGYAANLSSNTRGKQQLSAGPWGNGKSSSNSALQQQLNAYADPQFDQIAWLFPEHFNVVSDRVQQDRQSSNNDSSNKSSSRGWITKQSESGYTGFGNVRGSSRDIGNANASNIGQSKSLIRADQLRSLGLSPRGKQTPLNLLWLLILSTRIMRSSSVHVINVHGISKEEIRFMQKHCANDSILSLRNICESTVDESIGLGRFIGVENGISSKVCFVDLLKEAIGWRKHVIDTG